MKESSSLSDKNRFLERYRDEIKPVVSAEEATLLDHLYEGEIPPGQIDKILKEQETKIFLLEKKDAPPDALKVLLVGRDPGTAIGIKNLLEVMRREQRIGSIGVLIDGVAQNYLKSDLDDFKQIADKPLVMADIVESSKDPYDVIINTMSAANNPASFTIENPDLITQGRPKAKNYFLCEGYELAVDQKYYDDLDKLDGIFCNDPLAKMILQSRLRNLNPDHIYTTGTGQTDSLKLDQAEELMQSGREKLGIGSDSFVVSYLGTISQAYERYNLDPEVNEKSWRRTVSNMIELAKANPSKSYVLLYRYHPRDPNRESLFDEIKGYQIPDNLQIKKATNEQGISIDEAIYASNAIASMTVTENIKAHHRKRQGIYLGYEDPGMGGDYLRTYPPKIIEAMQREAHLKIVSSDIEMLDFLDALSKEPLTNPSKEALTPSSQKILEVIFSDQQ